MALARLSPFPPRHPVSAPLYRARSRPGRVRRRSCACAGRAHRRPGSAEAAPGGAAPRSQVPRRDQRSGSKMDEHNGFARSASGMPERRFRAGSRRRARGRRAPGRVFSVVNANSGRFSQAREWPSRRSPRFPHASPGRASHLTESVLVASLARPGGSATEPSKRAGTRGG
jgi:hypothetical protein